mgnify:FL=1
MEWTPYNNTTPWGLLSPQQKEMMKKAQKSAPNRLYIGADGLDYSDYKNKPSHVKRHYYRKGVLKYGRNNPTGEDWVDYDPNWSWCIDKFNVLRVVPSPKKAPPPPEPREFYIVLDHGKLIGYFNEYPVALQHYEIIKTKEQL